MTSNTLKWTGQEDLLIGMDIETELKESVLLIPNHDDTYL